MTTGTVNWFNDDMGFGLVTPDNGAKICSRTTPKSI